MVDSSNGKMEETQKLEPEEEDNTVVIMDVEQHKPEDDESVTEISVYGNSESVKETLFHDGGSGFGLDTNNSLKEEEEAKVADLGVLEEDGKEIVSSIVDPEEVVLPLGEEVTEKEVISSIVDPEEVVLPLGEEMTADVEALVDKLKDSDVIEVETKEIVEASLPSLIHSNGIAPVVTSKAFNVAEKTQLLPPLSSDQTNAGISEVMSSRNEEMKAPSSDEKDGLSSLVADVEKVLISADENFGVPPALQDAVSKGIEEAEVVASEKNDGESSSISNKKSTETTNDSSNPLSNATVIGSNDGIPETLGNPPIVSLNRRLQPTSWRSCCGLFEVLRRSERYGES